MALQSSFYNTDGSTRTFPSTKHIATKQHVSVYQKRIIDNVWVLVAVNDFSLINNSVVFDTAPDTAIYSQIEVRVADTADELEDSPSAIALVSASIANVNTVATNITAVTTTSSNIASVQTTSGSITNVNTVATNIASVNSTAGSIANVNTVAGSIANVNSVATTVVPNIAEILLADNNAAIATTKAGEATASATEAEHWANYTVDVAVPEGTGEFSAKHYATKAQQALAGLSIDAVPTNGSTNAVSSDGVFDGLATKQATLVSGTNIKTVNGVNILGSGDATVADSTKLPLAGGTMTGELVVKEFTETLYTITGTTPVIDPANGTLQKWVLTGNSTPTSNLVAGQAVLLKIDDGTAYAITWTSIGVTWVNATTAPSLPTTGYGLIVLWKDADATYGVKIGDVA